VCVSDSTLRCGIKPFVCSPGVLSVRSCSDMETSTTASSWSIPRPIVTILYGTQTGTALEVAEEVSRGLQRRYFKTRIFSMDDYDIVRLFYLLSVF
jgi:sulfite reductase alpha subunit-like flavoprotein